MLKFLNVFNKNVFGKPEVKQGGENEKESKKNACDGFICNPFGLLDIYRGNANNRKRRFCGGGGRV